MGVARADGYAAMDEVPVTGGELRLNQPVSVPGVAGAPASELIAFPLKKTDVSIDVAGMMARYTVEQTFENPFSAPIEAVYVFPLGDEAAVSGYEIIIGDRRVSGQIKTRKEARDTYEEAKRAGHTAALLEQEKPNVFQQRIANIAPGETIRVRISYTELLEYADGRYEVVFPMVVGPRYVPATNPGRNPVAAHPAGGAPRLGATSIAYTRPNTRPGSEVAITARIDACVPIRGFTSPSHTVAIERPGDTVAIARLDQPGAIPNKDFILQYKPAGPKTLVCMLTHRDPQVGPDGYFTLVVQPKAHYRTGDVVAREVVFLIDTSGSMNGQPLANAQYLTNAMIATLGDRDVFNVIAFADGVTQMSARPIAGDAAGKSQAIRWVQGLRAGGGTQMQRGVLHSLSSQPGGGRVRMVYVLTDGYVGNDDVILGAVQRSLAHNRIFPIGIGTAPNRYLMNRLGVIGRGFTSYASTPESAREVAQTLVKRSAYPYLTDVTIDWGGLAVASMTPARIPDVYADMPLVIAGRYRAPGQGTIAVKATAAGRKVVIPLTVSLPDNRPNEPVGHLWARRMISELMSAQPDGVDETTRKAVTRLGLAFGLVTQFTSFVAVDRSRVVGEDGQVRTVVQPAETPEGVDYDAAVGDGPAPAAPPPSPTVSAPRTPPRTAQRAPTRVNRDRPRYHSSGGGGGGSVGGDADPLTWLIVLCLVPGAVALRRRRREA